MFKLLFILFLAIPLLEIYLLIAVGGFIGAPATIGCVVLTAVLGGVLIRYQGFAALARARMALQRGELPALELMEGVLLLLAGALLLTPGFFTDAIGFLCLITPLRRRLLFWLVQRNLLHPQPPSDPERKQGPRTIEGEFWRWPEDRR